MDVPRNWRIRRQRYSLLGTVCEKCGAKSFPPEEICRKCSSSEIRSFAFCGRGEVFSYSTVYHPPHGFEDLAPYMVALVKLEEGPIISAQLTDVEHENVRIGMNVEMVTRKLREYGKEGVVVYGYKFRPVMGEL